jgi:hypothetical protein
VGPRHSGQAAGEPKLHCRLRAPVRSVLGATPVKTRFPESWIESSDNGPSADKHQVLAPSA